jgi:hypothetical protein
MRAFFRKDEQFRGPATWLRTWRPRVRVAPGAPPGRERFWPIALGLFFFLSAAASGGAEWRPYELATKALRAATT